jgi:hypothetical protein
MKVYSSKVDFDNDIASATKLEGAYDEPIIFHSYWRGNLSEKHYLSILSCYYFNVHQKKNRKIILWLENNISNEYNIEIAKYAEVKLFNLQLETSSGELKDIYPHNLTNEPTYISDYIRKVLLYNYGGCWFDLDILFLRDFSPLFSNFSKEICVYQWEYQNYPNNAIYFSLIPKNPKLLKIMEFISNRKLGWGFQLANLTYDLDLDFLVLPCAWFDGAWIYNSYNTGSIVNSCSKEYNFDNFFAGAFCFHWHNQWDKKIEDSSILRQLTNIIKKNLASNEKIHK